MTNRNKSFLLLLATSFAVSICIAQKPEGRHAQDNYRSVHWGLDEGLSQGEVYYMIKDIKGFLWIATSFGLNRFDGSSFKRYYADTSKKNKTITGNGITGLTEDSLHNIWIGTDKGLSCYNIKADSFKNFSTAVPTSVIPFWATKDEVFTIEYPATELTAYNIYSFARRTLIKLKNTDTVTYGISDRYFVFDAGSNSIWLEKGGRDWAGGGLLKISLADGKREEFAWPCYRNIPNHSHFSEGMRYDKKRNSIWINNPDGLIEFTLADNKFHHIDAMNELLKQKDYGSWAGIDIDLKGRVWIGTTPKGILIYDPSDNSIRVPFPEDSVQQKNVSDENVLLYCDRAGIVWSGFWSRKGIYQVIPFSPVAKRYRADNARPNSLSDDFVITCMDAGRGKIWVGTHNGMNIFDPQQETFLRLNSKNFPGLKTNVIVAIRIDTTIQKAWLGSDGVYEMNMATRQCRPIIFKDTNDQIIPDLHGGFPRQFRNSLLLTASFNDQTGIFIVNPDSPVARQVLSFSGPALNMFNVVTNEIDRIFVHRDDSISYQTYIENGGKWQLTACKLDSISWTRLMYDNNDQTYWAATFQRLLHYDKDFNLIKKYTTEDGVPEVEIFSIVQDKSGNTWFNTDQFIYQLNLKTGKVIKLTEKDGYQPQNFIAMLSGYCSANGDLYFPGGASGKGFDKIQPDKFVSPPSSVYMQSLQINQQPFPLTTGINNLDKLSLRYFENNITIETGIIDFYSKGLGKIRYKLELNGKAASWQYSSDHATIIYTGLPPGKYKLVMQASNVANEFNGPEKTLLININPAFWNTWWFRIAAAVLLLVAFYILIRYRTQQRFKLRLERTGKEKQIAELGQKTAELQQQKVEIEMQALRAQMNPHFIFNSLNSINRFILQNDRAQASEYLTKFSKLVRMILQNSQASLISLESELEALGLYLEMEALRFNYHFDYKITTSKDLDIEVLQVPPLILQPYVENAIWHGLMHKEEKGHLNVEVVEKDDQLYLSISDNGIGRKKAEELASKSATKHKSMGLRITKDRIAMLQKTSEGESPVKIIDLEHEDGSAAGTEVIVKMPVIYEQNV